MSRFTVFDVETPNRMSNRMSAIGITVIEGGDDRRRILFTGQSGNAL